MIYYKRGKKTKDIYQYISETFLWRKSVLHK